MILIGADVYLPLTIDGGDLADLNDLGSLEAEREEMRRRAEEAEKERKLAEARERRKKIAAGKVKRDERLALLGCECASCSTVCGLEFDISVRALQAGRKENPVHEYMAMRAYAADRISGGGMAWYVFRFYVTCIALVMRLDRFDTGWGFDDEYVVGMRNEAFRLALEHGFLPYLGYEFDVDTVRKYLEENPAQTWEDHDGS